MTPTSPRREFLRLASAAALVGVAGCSAGAREEETSPSPEPAGSSPTLTDGSSTATPTETEAESDETVEVGMITDNQGSYFDPKGLLIEPGTSVRFVNKSGSHGSTAYHPDNDDHPLRIPEEATPWDSGVFTEPDKTYEVTFDIEGVYDYYCQPHESLGMVGRIIVAEPQGGPGTTPPDELPPSARDKLPSIESITEQGVVNGP